MCLIMISICSGVLSVIQMQHRKDGFVCESHARRPLVVVGSVTDSPFNVLCSSTVIRLPYLSTYLCISIDKAPGAMRTVSGSGIYGPLSFWSHKDIDLKTLDFVASRFEIYSTKSVSSKLKQ